jgi:hypothetical protein
MHYTTQAHTETITQVLWTQYDGVSGLIFISFYEFKFYRLN